MLIRPEQTKDYEQIYAVNAAAFPTPAEALLVNQLRANANPIISLVAERNGEIIGHIMFSHVTLTGNTGLKIMGLAPMAVLPEHQQSGIGSQLVTQGLTACKTLGYLAVVVLGHPNYYPRFGFTASSAFNIKSAYDVPDDVFMAQELIPGNLNGACGIIKYHEAFNSN